MRPRVWKRLLGVDDKTVIEHISYDEDTDTVIAHVRVRKPKRQRRCGRCQQPAPGFDQGDGRRRWRALDLGTTKVFLEAEAPRVTCPQHKVTVAWVPWARHDARFTTPFEEQAAWLATHTSQSAVKQLMRIAWASVGRIITRVVAERGALIDPLADLRRIGIDEISYRKGQKYLIVVVDHDSGRLVWAAPGRDKKTLRKFFDLLGPDRCQAIRLVSADAAECIAGVVAERCRNATLCLDPFHIVQWATDALDEVRREVWNDARRAGQKALAKDLKGARYALWKNPQDLTDRQQAKLSDIRRTNDRLYRAYLMKEQLRMVFHQPTPAQALVSCP